MDKCIVLLNGPSSSGKSTIAFTLEKAIIERNSSCAIVSIDNFLKMSSDEVIYEDDVYDISPQLIEKTAAELSKNNCVIIDHVITSKRIYDGLMDSFKNTKIFVAHITCPTEILRKREIERKNRCIGSAENSEIYLYPKSGYDITLDTSVLSSCECAEEIIKLIYNTI